MIYGHHPQADVVLPEWANTLKHYYWFIRVEGKDLAKRRRYYRLIKREKLRLVEHLHLNQDLIEATCRYLSCFNKSSGRKLINLLNEKNIQLTLNF